MSSIIFTKIVGLLKDNHYLSKSVIFPKQQTFQAIILREMSHPFSMSLCLLSLSLGEGVEPQGSQQEPAGILKLGSSEECLITKLFTNMWAECKEIQGLRSTTGTLSLPLGMQGRENEWLSELGPRPFGEGSLRGTQTPGSRQYNPEGQKEDLAQPRTSSSSSHFSEGWELPSLLLPAPYPAARLI